MMTPKFWKHLKDYGLLYTYTRPHRASRHSHLAAGSGTESYVKCKG